MALIYWAETASIDKGVLAMLTGDFNRFGGIGEVARSSTGRCRARWRRPALRTAARFTPMLLPTRA